MKVMRMLVVVGSISLLMLMSGCDFVDSLKARHQLNKGVKAFRDKAYEDAAANFQEALKLDPQLTIAYEYLATTYMNQFVPNLFTDRNLKNANMAIEFFKKTLEFEPKNVNAMQRIAQLYYQINEYDNSKEWYRKFQEVEPQNPVPLYGIGVIDWNIVNQATGPNGEYAEQLSQEEKDKLNATIDEGIDALKQALEIKQDYYEAMSFLNLCYRKKAMLVDDEEMKNEYIRQADRLAAQSLILKKKQEREAAEEKSKIF